MVHFQGKLSGCTMAKDTYLLPILFVGGGKPSFCLMCRRASGPGALCLEQCWVSCWGHSVVLQGRALTQEDAPRAPPVPPKPFGSAQLPRSEVHTVAAPGGPPASLLGTCKGLPWEALVAPSRTVGKEVHLQFEACSKPNRA